MTTSLLFARLAALSHCGRILLAALLIAPAASASDGAERLDDYLRGLTTLEANFHQITFNADRSQMLESDGRLFLQRPGRFRWEYATPFEQVIIADGKRVYVHDIELEQVYHRSQREALRGTPALLLTKDEPVSDLFEIASTESGSERDWVVLRPRDPETEIERIEIGFDGERLDTLIMVDGFGQVTQIRFADIRRNVALDDELFKLDQAIGGDFLELD